MSQSLSVVYIHLVFSTKERRPWLQDPQLRAALHAQLGGVEDHVHLVARFGRTIAQADWVKELKRVSSRWLKEQSGSLCDFAWQGGYADFSVSQSNLSQVKDYVANQEEHHHKRSFKDELRMLLSRHEVEWDERYVWD